MAGLDIAADVAAMADALGITPGITEAEARAVGYRPVQDWADALGRSYSHTARLLRTGKGLECVVVGGAAHWYRVRQ